MKFQLQEPELIVFYEIINVSWFGGERCAGEPLYCDGDSSGDVENTGWGFSVSVLGLQSMYPCLTL